MSCVYNEIFFPYDPLDPLDMHKRYRLPKTFTKNLNITILKSMTLFSRSLRWVEMVQPNISDQ